MVKRLGSSVLGHCVESFLASPSAARFSDQVYHTSTQRRVCCTRVYYRSTPLLTVSGRGTQSTAGGTFVISVQVAPMGGGSVQVFVRCLALLRRHRVFVSLSALHMSYLEVALS